MTGVDADLVRLLKRLKLGPLVPTLPERLALARARQLDYAAFLTLLLADEVQRRDQQALECHLIQAGFEDRVALQASIGPHRSNSIVVNSSACSPSSSWPAKNTSFSSNPSGWERRYCPSAWAQPACAPVTRSSSSAPMPCWPSSVKHVPTARTTRSSAATWHRTLSSSTILGRCA